MKKIIFSAFIFLSFCAYAQTKNDGPGVGIMIGEPTGLSFRYSNFPVIGLAWSLRNDSFHLQCDYWLLNKSLKAPVDWYIGPGLKYLSHKDEGRHHDDTDNWLGIRIPVGLQYFPDNKIEIFGEIVPGIYVYPETDFFIDAALGARFFFF